MRLGHLESKNENNQPSLAGWLKHHASQIAKGIFVGGLTFAAYLLGKRAGGAGSSASIDPKTPSEQAKNTDVVIAEQPFQQQYPKFTDITHGSHIEEHLASPPEGNSVSHPSSSQQFLSLADELAISFPEDEIMSNDSSNSKVSITEIRLNSDNSETEDKTIIVDEKFQIKIPGYKLGPDGKTHYFGTMSATLEDGTPLPSWMRLEPPSIPFYPKIIGSVKTKVVLGVTLKEDLALISADGLQLINISDPKNPQVISRVDLPSINWKVAMQQDLAVVITSQAGLQLINISDPRYPKLMSSKTIASDTRGVVVQRGLAAVTAYSGSLQIVNITDCKHPSIIGSQVIPGHPFNVAMRNNLALVATYSEGLQLVNISRPKHPKIISSKKLRGNAQGIAIQEDLVLVSTEFEGIHLINISNLKQPLIISSLNSVNSASDVAVHGDLAFMAAEFDGLWIVNISNPLIPQSVTQQKLNSDSRSIAVHKNLVLLGCRGGVNIIDLQDWGWTLSGIPSKNELASIKNIVFKSRSISGITYQKHLRLHSRSRPFINQKIPNLNIKPRNALSYRFASEFFDMSDGIIPFQNLEFSQMRTKPLPSWLAIEYKPVLGNQPMQGGFLSIALQEDLAFGITRFNGLKIINISNPKSPMTIATQTFPGIGQGVAVYNDLVLVAADTAGLHLINVSNPKYPWIISSKALAGNPWCVTVKNDLAFVAARSGGLQLINISDPKYPWVISSQILAGDAFDVIVNGDIAIVAVYFGGLQLVNISNPKNLLIVGTMPLPGCAYGVALSGDIAAVATATYLGGLQLVNISNPRHPRVVSSQSMPGSTTVSVTIKNHLALVVVSDVGLQLVNISNPFYPKIVDSIDTFGAPTFVTTRDDFVFLTGFFGLNIMQLGLSAGVMSMQPSQADHGNYFINITARNFNGIMNDTSFRISVNNPPVLKKSIVSLTVNVGQVISFQLSKNVFWDEDGDELSFNSTLTNGTPLPDWITFFAASHYQIYTIIPSSTNRGNYNISVKVDDGYYGQAQAWFLLTVPTRKPEKINDIPLQNAFIWRLFKLIVIPQPFLDLDGDSLDYHAQLKGNHSLPKWLHFDNTTCVTGCRFEGQPGLADFSDLEVVLIARSKGGETSAEFTVVVRSSTFFEDLAKLYSVSGAGLVFLNLFARLWRWKRMQAVRAALIQREGKEVIFEQKRMEQKRMEQKQDQKGEYVKNLLDAVGNQQIQQLEEYVKQYRQHVVKSAKQDHCTVTEIADPWKIIKKIVKEIENRAIRKFDYKLLLSWIRVLHELLKIIVEIDTGHGRIVRKNDKEDLLALLTKAKKYIVTSKQHGVLVKHQLELCQEALISMDDTNSIIDNLCCRDSDMFVEILKIMVIPPYGMMRLIFQIENIPGGWYPSIIQLCRLAEAAQESSASLSQLQVSLKQQTNWHVLYEGVGLLGQVARSARDEKIRKQALQVGPKQSPGLRFYQNFNGFWIQRCSGPGCDNRREWIRKRAFWEANERDDKNDDQDIESGLRMHSLSQPLLLQ